LNFPGRIIPALFVGFFAVAFITLIGRSSDTPVNDPVVLTVGDTKLTATEVQKLVDALPPQFRAFYSGQGRSKLADFLVTTELLVKEARKRQLESRPDVQLQIRIATNSILSNATKLDLQKQWQLTDTELQNYLDEHKLQFEEARARRIVIRSRSSLAVDPNKSQSQTLSDDEAHAKADDLKKQLVAGAEFEELAAKFSDDSLTSGKGGDLGFNRRGSKAHLIVPPLEEKIFSMQPGEVSDVIQTALGYEIVKLDEKRMPTLKQVHKELEQAVLNQKSEEFLKELRSHETIVIDEKYFANTKPSGKAQ
jgi:peptidyl-prolyl cis-trans isomerase C